MTAIRRPGAASAALLIGLSTTIVAAHVLAPEWSRRTGLDVWNLPALEDSYRAATEERSQVDAFADSMARRREIADHLAAELAAGRLALAEVADRMNELFADEPGWIVITDSLYPDSTTPRLRGARHAIDRATRNLENPAEIAVVKARLVAEFRSLAAPPAPPAVQ
jgi:hypothetical protein